MEAGGVAVLGVTGFGDGCLKGGGVSMLMALGATGSPEVSEAGGAVWWPALSCNRV